MYKSLLTYFRVKQNDDDLFDSVGYVKPDHIHEAIEKVGPFMDQPLKHYIQKAKQLAIDEYRTNQRRRAILETNAEYWQYSGIPLIDLQEYFKFSDREILLINERTAGIKAYKSAIPRREYEKLMTEIKRKVKR